MAEQLRKPLKADTMEAKTPMLCVERSTLLRILGNLQRCKESHAQEARKALEAIVR